MKHSFRLEILSALLPALYQAGQVAKSLKYVVSPEIKTPDSDIQQSTVVTVADRICQEIIFLALAEDNSNCAIYSEELKDLPADILDCFAQKHTELFFIDPIDGTENYVKGGDAYSIMGGMLNKETNLVEMSFVYFPETLTLYSAGLGEGVFKQVGFWGQTEKLPKMPSNFQHSHSIPLVKRMTHADHHKIINQTDCEITCKPGIDNCGGTLIDLLEGKHAVVIMRDFHGHDSAPVALMLRELGGFVTGEDGEDVQFSADMARIPLTVFTYNKNLRRLFAV